MKAIIVLSIWVIIVTILSLIPDNNVYEKLFPFQDKVLHIIFYLVMTFLLRRIFADKQKTLLFKAIIPASFYGFSMECLQGILNTGRHFDYYDIIANIIGSLLGSLLFYLFRKNH